jgi:hypothetical protein
MAPTLDKLEVDQCAPDEHLADDESLQKSTVPDVETALVPPAQLAEFERRLADSIAHPEAVVPWDEVKLRALMRART